MSSNWLARMGILLCSVCEFGEMGHMAWLSRTIIEPLGEPGEIEDTYVRICILRTVAGAP